MTDDDQTGDSRVEEEQHPFPDDLPLPLSLDGCLSMLAEDIPNILAQRGFAKSDLPFPPKIVAGLTQREVDIYADVVVPTDEAGEQKWRFDSAYGGLQTDYWRINMLFLQLHGENSYKAEDIRVEMRKLAEVGVAQSLLLFLIGGAWIHELTKEDNAEMLRHLRAGLRRAQRTAASIKRLLSKVRSNRELGWDISRPETWLACLLCPWEPSEPSVRGPADEFEANVDTALDEVKCRFDALIEDLREVTALGGGLSPRVHRAYEAVASEIRTQGRRYYLKETSILFSLWGITITPEAHKEWRKRHTKRER